MIKTRKKVIRKINCKSCKVLFETNSNATEYCINCGGKKRDAITKKAIRTKNKTRLSKKIKNGNVIWNQDFPLPDFDTVFTFSIPYIKYLSKNRMKAFAGGHYYLPEETRKAKEHIIYPIKNSKIKFIQSKLYIELFIEKPKHQGDAINFIDTIADAIVQATGIDDRWYCIGRVDWQINKINPKIWITIKQDRRTQHQPCGNCGRILPFSSFGPSPARKNGIRNHCKECSVKKTRHKKYIS